MAIQRLSATILFLTFCLIMLGGVVHTSGSSLACPDWPLCYGQIMPEMKGGVAIEHSHRLLASAVGFLTIILVVLSYRKAARPMGLGGLSIVALVLVIFQGILGGLTVIYRLPTAVSTTHLATSMIFFSTILWITLKARYGANFHRKVSPLVWIATAVLYSQIIVGGLVRHTGASIVCTDIPFCLGDPWPLHLHPTTRLHMFHRYWALVVTGLLLWVGMKGLSKGGKIRHISQALMICILIQVALGVLSVLTTLAMPIVTAHLAMGAVLLSLMVAMIFFSNDTARTLD